MSLRFRPPVAAGGNRRTGEQARSHLFRLDLREVSTVALDESGEASVIDVWTAARGVRTIRRA